MCICTRNTLAHYSTAILIHSTCLLSKIENEKTASQMFSISKNFDQNGDKVFKCDKKLPYVQYETEKAYSEKCGDSVYPFIIPGAVGGYRCLTQCLLIMYSSLGLQKVAQSINDKSTMLFFKCLILGAVETGLEVVQRRLVRSYFHRYIDKVWLKHSTTISYQSSVIVV